MMLAAVILRIGASEQQPKIKPKSYRSKISSAGRTVVVTGVGGYTQLQHT